MSLAENVQLSWWGEDTLLVTTDWPLGHPNRTQPSSNTNQTNDPELRRRRPKPSLHVLRLWRRGTSLSSATLVFEAGLGRVRGSVWLRPEGIAGLDAARDTEGVFRGTAVKLQFLTGALTFGIFGPTPTVLYMHQCVRKRTHKAEHNVDCPYDTDSNCNVVYIVKCTRVRKFRGQDH